MRNCDLELFCFFILYDCVFVIFFTWPKLERGTYYFYSHLIAYKSVTWEHVISKNAEKCSLSSNLRWKRKWGLINNLCHRMKYKSLQKIRCFPTFDSVSFIFSSQYTPDCHSFSFHHSSLPSNWIIGQSLKWWWRKILPEF